MSEASDSSGRNAWLVAAGVLFLLFVSALGCFGLLGMICWPGDGSFVVHEFELKNDTRIRIVAAPTDVNLELQLEVWRGGILDSRRWWGAGFRPDRDNATFRLLSLNGDNLVAIYDKSRPHELLFIYDLEANELWPAQGPVGERLIQRVREATGDNRYTYDFFNGRE